MLFIQNIIYLFILILGMKYNPDMFLSFVPQLRILLQYLPKYRSMWADFIMEEQNN